MSGGARAWPKGPDLRSGAVGLRGFESRPPHHISFVGEEDDAHESKATKEAYETA